jgi:hypothetical protein
MNFSSNDNPKNDRTNRIIDRAKVQMPIFFTPINMTLISAFAIFFAGIFGESTSARKNLVWIVSTNDFAIIALGFTALISGLLLPKNKPKPIKAYDLFSLLQPARNLTIIGILAHVIFIGFYLAGITAISSSGKLGTIPGVTTLTQVLPVGLTTLYGINKLQKWSNKDRNLFVFGITLCLFRVFLNSERLALLEVLFPVFLVFLSFQNRSKKDNLRQSIYLGSASLLIAVLYFGFFEYFRSWQRRKYSWSGDYGSYVIERIGNYYATSINNGAIYYEYRDYFSQFPIITFDFLYNMPLVSDVFFSDNSQYYSWNRMLILVTNTDEFNNTAVMLSLAKDISYFGMVLFLFFVGRYYRKIAEQVKIGDFYSLIVLSTTCIAFLELSRVQWWTLGRAIPIYLGLIYLHASKKKKSN